MFLVAENKWLKLWYFIVTMAGLAGIVTTLSRGGWASIPVSMAVVFFTLIRHKMRSTRSFVGLFMAGMLFLGVFYYYYPTIEKRLSLGDYGSAATRAPLNRAALSVIKQFPVFGVGINNLAKVFKTYDTTGGSSLFRTSTHVVHNLFLAVWAETGTIGILAFLWMFVATMIIAIKNLFKSVPTWQQGILIGAVAGLLAQMIHGMVDPGFRILMNVSMLVYSMFGLVGAISILNKYKNEKAEIDTQYE
jgi:O-antigen ligase